MGQETKPTEWPAVWSALAGPDQTTPRAELAAFAWACQHAEGDIEVFTDHLALVHTFNNALGTAHLHANGDLWAVVQEAAYRGKKGRSSPHG